MGIRFTLKQGTGAGPRLGVLETAHGSVETPAFFPVGTLAAVKGLTPDLVRGTGTRGLLVNAFHLVLRPGVEAIEALGGLHRFMRWDGALITDSGGYQVFSLSERRRVDDEGVVFSSPVDGSEVRLTPRSVLEAQGRLGTDVAMPLDQPVPFPSGRTEAQEAAARTLRWAETSRRALEAPGMPAVFGIVQGGTFADLRERCARELAALGFPGYAVGGVSVGEGPERMDEAVAAAAPHLPPDRPRYLMGVGTPRDILSAISLGMDLFDCVLPTRNGRTGQAFTPAGILRLRNARFAIDPSPIDPDCACPACSGGFSRGYVRHLFASGEMLGPVLCSLHNIRFYQDLMADAREAIREGRFEAFRAARGRDGGA
jgi:queuine tRNA-ribosyltransferase